MVDICFMKVCGNYRRRVNLRDFWYVMAFAAAYKEVSLEKLVKAAVKGFQNPDLREPTDEEWVLPKWKPKFVVLHEHSFNKRQFT